MYWLYGAPSIFAVNNNDIQPVVSHDNVPAHGSPDNRNRGIEPLESEDNDGTGTPNPGEEQTLEGTEEETARREPLVNGGAEKQRERTLQTNGQIQDEMEKSSGIVTGIRISRNGHMFATITSSSLTLWQSKPTVAVASVVRSPQSLSSYGRNVHVLLRPDSAIIVVQTVLGFLITYSLATDPQARLYRHIFPDSMHGHSRHKSFSGRIPRADEDIAGPGEGGGVRDVSIRFRMVIKIDAGISRVLVQDDELVVATTKPAAIQCIRWTPDSNGSQTSTELLKSMAWLGKKTTIVDMVYDRPMNLSCWITSDGKAYAVQRLPPQGAGETANATNKLFKGYGFHLPNSERVFATRAAICARFSLLAVGCADGSIHVYAAKDYSGHIPLSHTLPAPASPAVAGELTFLCYSPDGYCLFAGYTGGWASWSVYGKPTASSFASDHRVAETNDERWLLGVSDGIWIGHGAQLLLLGHRDNRLWMLDMARSAVTGCFSPANIVRSLLQTSSGFMVYRGYDVSDLSALSSELGLWHHVQIPVSYLAHNWPIRSAVISPDGKYVAIAGRRGLAHYSVHSGRWKTFDDPVIEGQFTVRGGMCWHQHVLVAAVETAETYEIRVYSRESPLDDSHIVHVEHLPSPIVLLSPSGADSLLVYTYENQLYHFIITASGKTVKLVQVGQIGLHGIIRSPPRVRGLSWILPDEQLENGDPAQDVAVATVVFLVDGKLVLLQPSAKESGELKYDMRIIASNVEYYTLMRDQHHFRLTPPQHSDPPSPAVDPNAAMLSQNDLRDSLWYFDGLSMKVWTDVQDILSSAPVSGDTPRELPPPISIFTDFYPLSVILGKGILFGIEAELTQRRDISFAFSRFATRTHLFLPSIFRHHLSQYNQPSALYLSHYYQHLPYFPHALEVLLHNVLDDEVDSPPETPEAALLPSTLSFLSSFPQFLDIIVQCTRKTEVRSWRTLFAHLPPPRELFESALQDGRLKTAGGYLLILNTLEENALASPTPTATVFPSATAPHPPPGATVSGPGRSDGEREDQVVRLLRAANQAGDFELCKELARFLMALDPSGRMLREALNRVGLLRKPGSPTPTATGPGTGPPLTAVKASFSMTPSNSLEVKRSRTASETSPGTKTGAPHTQPPPPATGSGSAERDYFSLGT